MPSDDDYRDMAKGREKVIDQCEHCGMKFHTKHTADTVKCCQQRIIIMKG
jgi:hypothetical protein